QRDEAGQLVARRRLPADLRLEVHVTPVDDRVEERDRMLLRRELAHAADDERAFRHLRREAVRLAVVGEHLAAVQRRVIGPDVEARDEWFGGASCSPCVRPSAVSCESWRRTTADDWLSAEIDRNWK